MTSAIFMQNLRGSQYQKPKRWMKVNVFWVTLCPPWIVQFYASVYSLVLVLIEKIYKKPWETFFYHISKHHKVHQKFSAACCILNSLFSVWKCHETHSPVFLCYFKDSCIGSLHQNYFGLYLSSNPSGSCRGNLLFNIAHRICFLWSLSGGWSSAQHWKTWQPLDVISEGCNESHDLLVAMTTTLLLLSISVVIRSLNAGKRNR